MGLSHYPGGATTILWLINANYLKVDKICMKKPVDGMGFQVLWLAVSKGTAMQYARLRKLFLGRQKHLVPNMIAPCPFRMHIMHACLIVTSKFMSIFIVFNVCCNPAWINHGNHSKEVTPYAKDPANRSFLKRVTSRCTVLKLGPCWPQNNPLLMMTTGSSTSLSISTIVEDSQPVWPCWVSQRWVPLSVEVQIASLPTKLGKSEA